MRVLHVYSGNLYGGVETALLALASACRHDADMVCDFAVAFAGRLLDELKQAGETVWKLPPVRVGRPWSVLAGRAALGRILDAGAYDAVVCHSPWAQAVFGPAVRTRGIPLVFWLHDALEGRHWLERWASRTRPSLVIANSRYTARTVGRIYKDARTEVIYCPVRNSSDQERGARNRVRASLDTPADSVVIFQASRLEPWKGHELLIDALHALRDVAGWTCWIAGGAQRPHEAAYLRSLQQRIGELGLTERVQFLGQRSDVRSLFASVDVHCQPNLGPEPFGIAFIEAMYAGVPVVTTRLGGAIEIVDEACGVLTPPGDAGALAGALRRLVTSPAVRKTLGDAGPRRAADLCDPVQQAGRLADVLRSLQPRALKTTA